MKSVISGIIARLTPRGLAGRFVLLLTVALVLANFIAVILLVAESRRIDRESQDARTVERMVTLVSALESVDRSLWQAIAADSSNRAMQLTIERIPSVSQASGDPRAVLAATQLKEALPNREIFSKIVMRQNLRMFQRKNLKRAEPLPQGQELVISIALKSRAGKPVWLNSVSAATTRSAGPGLRVLLTGLGLSLAAVLGVGMLFVRQLVGPLSELASAANKAAGGDRSARVAIKGATEFRQTGAAFNDMQVKIARFDAERMRTLAAVGHDLRTPITSLRIRSEMIDDEPMRDAFVRTLEDMTVMADGLVQFAKSGHENEPKQQMDLAQFLTRLCKERNVGLTVRNNAMIAIGPVSMARAIGNLIENAQRYAGSAKVILDANVTHASIIVEDNGPGIAPEKIDQMFEPFVRGDDSRNAETGGAGLGLSITRAIVVAHGGQIRLENIQPQGLQATITLPL